METPWVETLSPEIEWPGTSLTDYLQAAGVTVAMAESGVVDGDGGRWTRIVADQDVTQLMAAFVPPPEPPDPVALLTERIASLGAALQVALIGTEAQKADVAEQMSSVEIPEAAARSVERLSGRAPFGA